MAITHWVLKSVAVGSNPPHGKIKELNFEFNDTVTLLPFYLVYADRDISATYSDAAVWSV